jgi:N-methylhydantoinase A
VFAETYEATYGRTLDDVPAIVQTLRTAVTGRRPSIPLSLFAPAADATLADAERGTRPVWADGAWHDAPVFDRLALPVGASAAGPCVLQQPDTTIFVDAGLVATVDELGNVVMEAAP